MNRTSLFAIGTSAAVIAVVIAGLFIAGSPQQERMRMADQQRLNDIQQISYAVDTYWNRNQAFPGSLEDLAKSPDVYVTSIRDPRTIQPYEFRTTDADSYELCAAYELTTPTRQPGSPIPATETFWDHGVGRTCYALDVRKNENQLKMVPPSVME